MKATCTSLTLISLVSATCLAAAPATEPITNPADAVASADIAVLRNELIDSYNKGDVDRLLTLVEPSVVATWQNGEVCHGPAELRAYYNKMLTGPDRVASKVTCDPVVDGRTLYDNSSISWGHLNDSYVLTDGKTFSFDSHFTAVLRHHDGAWKVAAFHASVNAFDNPVLKLAEKKVTGIAGAGGGAVGLIVGLVGGLLVSRRRRASA